MLALSAQIELVWLSQEPRILAFHNGRTNIKASPHLLIVQSQQWQARDCNCESWCSMAWGLDASLCFCKDEQFHWAAHSLLYLLHDPKADFLAAPESSI